MMPDSYVMKSSAARTNMLLSRTPAPLSTPAAALPPRPYEVRLRHGVGGTVMMIGHDGRGGVLAEFRVPRAKLTERMVAKFERWCRENDDERGPALSVIT